MTQKSDSGMRVPVKGTGTKGQAGEHSEGEEAGEDDEGGH